MSTASTSFVQIVHDNQLLKPEQLDEVRRNLQTRHTDPRALAKALVQRAWLTPYQANLLLAGKANELILGPYRILDRLGEGGMGTVFKAWHVRMERTVALKVIAKDRLTNSKAVQRFFREAKAAGQLQHPNIVLAYDADQVGDTQFFAMEYVEGIDLAKLVKDKGPLLIPQACAFIRQAALGLQHAHEKGVVHRDIKPANLLVTQPPSGTPLVKVLDFGLALLENDPNPKTRLTKLNSVLGTVDYIAPEQAENASAADIRSDIYSLGCTLFFLLTSRPPFTGSDPIGRMTARLLEDPPLVRTLRAEVPPALEQVVNQMLARKPEQRYQTPAEVVAALEPFVPTPPDKKTTKANPPPLRKGASKSPLVPHHRGSHSRKRWLVTALAVLVTGVATVMVLGNLGTSTNPMAESAAGQPSSKTGSARSHDPKATIQRDDPGLAAQQAVGKFREESNQSHRQMAEKVAAARTRLLASLDQAHAQATKANQPDAVREIQEARATLTSAIWGEATEEKTLGPSRAEFGKLLLAKQWYWCWENRNQEQPFRYRPDGSLEFKSYPGSWSFEQRHVLKHRNCYLLVMDDSTLHGFFIPTGRQVGSIADDKAKPVLVDPADRVSGGEARTAILQYRKAVHQARREMTDRLATARKTLVASLDAAEATAARNNQQNVAVAIRETRTSLLNNIWGEATEEKLTGPSRSDVVKMLTSRSWCWHWENRDRDRPYRFLPDGSTEGAAGGGSWAIETRIVLKQTDHYLILTDNNTLQGFHHSTGRQVGAFTEIKP